MNSGLGLAVESSNKALLHSSVCMFIVALAMKIFKGLSFATQPLGRNLMFTRTVDPPPKRNLESLQPVRLTAV